MSAATVTPMMEVRDSPELAKAMTVFAEPVEPEQTQN
jgi:hypothetical protein